MKVNEQLQALFDDLRANVDIAQQMRSFRVEDDLLLKAAIVGFSKHAPIGSWTDRNLAFLNARLETDFSLQNLECFKDEAPFIQLFAASCLGCILGMYQAQEMTETEFLQADALIPGFIFLKSGKFQEKFSK